MNAAAREVVQESLPLATPRALAFLQLQADPLFHRVKAARRHALIDAALEDGRALGVAHRREFGADPRALAARARVTVWESAREAGFGATVVCAEYRERTQHVVLYTPVLGRLQAACTALGSPFCSLDVHAAFLAHELYHHLDCGRGPEALASRHRIDLLRLGRWRWTSGVASLAEIAAGAFAQSLLGLPFHAKLLELLVLLEANPAAGPRYVEALAAATLAVIPPDGVPA
jgi:hypothetical protein